MGPKEFGSRLRYIQGKAAEAGKTLSDYRYFSVFLRIPFDTPPQSGMPAAEGIRFADVERFVAKLNSLCPPGCTFRLPTEAEWEAACRLKDERRFEGEEPDEVCWSRENSGGAPHPVAQKKPNFLGIFDLHGNVAEWCLDGYAPLVRPAFDPIAPVPANGMRVVRGGSWADPASECGSEVRRGAGPKDTGIGIRLVLEY
jgi:formylglycine-generating enzyme required for sulfatase activity